MIILWKSNTHLRSSRTVCGSGLSSTNYPDHTHPGSLCGPSTINVRRSIQEINRVYRVPHLAKLYIGHIIHLDDNVIIARHVGQVLTRRNFLGHPGDITLDYEHGQSQTPNGMDVPNVKLSQLP